MYSPRYAIPAVRSVTLITIAQAKVPANGTVLFLSTVASGGSRQVDEDYEQPTTVTNLEEYRPAPPIARGDCDLAKVEDAGVLSMNPMVIHRPLRKDLFC